MVKEAEVRWFKRSLHEAHKVSLYLISVGLPVFGFGWVIGGAVGSAFIGAGAGLLLSALLWEISIVIGTIFYR